MIRRGRGHRNCAKKITDRFTSNRHKSGGGFTLKKNLNVQITATCFSNQHTNLGAHRSRRLGVMTATNLVVSDPCVFGYILQEKEPIETFYISS